MILSTLPESLGEPIDFSSRQGALGRPKGLFPGR